MLTFVAPVWLLGLLSVPAIRWLHRGGPRRRAVPVSRLELWRRSAASSVAAGERQPPDPAWRRRALLAALLFVALAVPQLPEPSAGITLWIDDSPSMLTREAAGTRIAAGLARARSLLAEMPTTDVTVRTLGDPWRSLGELTDATATTVAAGAGRKVPSPPPGALLRRDREHWLVTDGAHPTLLEWPGGRRPNRIVQVGAVTRNVGLERLSARRSLSDPERYDLLLKVVNGGTAAETREVAIATDTERIAGPALRLEPGESALVTASIAAAATARATLGPADALVEDDEIVVDLSPLRRRRVAVDGKCPEALRAAVDAHPALARAETGSAPAEAALDCGAGTAAGRLPAVRVIADRAPARPRAALQWSSAVPESQRFVLDLERLRVAAHLEAPAAADAVLLAAGDEPLIVGRAGVPRAIETSLDFASADAMRAAETPLLANLMFERLFDSGLLDATAVQDRGPGSVNVAPSAGVATDAGAPATAGSPPRHDAASPILVAALLVLLWEIAALARNWYRWAEWGRAESG